MKHQQRRNIMKQHRFISIIMLAGLLLVTGFATNAMAWVSAACDTISNQATLSYSVGGVPQTDIDSDSDGDGTPETTDFQVGSLVDLTVSAITYPVNATGSDQVMTFRIDNTGNDTQRYELAVVSGTSGDTLDSGAVTDNFDMSTDVGQSVDVYTDTDNNYSNGGTTLIQASVPTDGTALGTLTADVAALGTIYVHIVADVPAGTAAGSVAIYSLSANTYQIATLPGTTGVNGTETGNSATDGNTDNSCATGVALADGDSDLATSVLTGITDAANDGEFYASSYYVVNTADISVDKRMTKVVWDPVNEGTNPIAIPGAYIQYEITISNAVTAGASATLNTITDDLSLGGLAFDPDLVVGASTDPGPPSFPDDPENALGEGFHVVVTGSTRPAAHVDQYLTTTNDGDGADFGLTTANTVTATLQVILPADGGTGYAAGELKPGEDVTITFNAIIP
jgi:hypothetical protein